jgi:hypothetical protein
MRLSVARNEIRLLGTVLGTQHIKEDLNYFVAIAL